MIVFFIDRHGSKHTDTHTLTHMSMTPITPITPITVRCSYKGEEEAVHRVSVERQLPYRGCGVTSLSAEEQEHPVRIDHHRFSVYGNILFLWNTTGNGDFKACRTWGWRDSFIYVEDDDGTTYRLSGAMVSANISVTADPGSSASGSPVLRGAEGGAVR